MTIDEAKRRFDELAPAWREDRERIQTEQDARFQVIDRLLTEVLGWEHEDVRTERHGDSGYADYLITLRGRAVLVIEAKRAEKILIDTRKPKVGQYKVGGPALQGAQEGIGQARRYCLDHGVLYAALTSGFEWLAFTAIRSDGKNPADGTAITFPSLETISDDFALFYDLFSKEGISSQVHRVRLQEAEGLHVRASEQWDTIAKRTDSRLLEKSAIAADLERIFGEFFSTMSGENDPAMLAQCFVESKESKEADANLEKITRNLVNRVEVVDARKGAELVRHLQDAIETHRGEFVLIIGNKGAGKSTFIDRFFRLVLHPHIKERCLVARVDVADSAGDLSTINQWLTDRLRSRLEEQLFAGSTPTFEQLQGVFFREYRRWSEGEYKFLYDSNREAFKIKFGEYLHDLINDKTG